MFTLSDVGRAVVNGRQVELGEDEKQAIVDAWNNAPDVAPVEPARRVISPREARARINSYWPAILTASRSDDDVYDWIIQANAGPIELDNPLTVRGLDALIAAGLLDQAGKDAFLADAEGGYPA